MQHIPRNNDIILTGLARSGTTLTCHILNTLPQTVALHEPIDPSALRDLSAPDTIAYITKFFDEQRRTLLEEGLAVSKTVNGVVPDNPVGSVRAISGRRGSLPNGKSLRVTKHLSKEFTLCIKHPGIFSVLLPYLSNHFRCFSIVRNPLSVILSWNSTEFPVAQGRMPAAESLDSTLAAQLDKEPDILNRQIILIGYCCNKYLAHTPNSIIRYEDIISTGGRELRRIDESASNIHIPLNSLNENPLYDMSQIKRIADRLLETDGTFWQLYKKSDVEQLIDKTTQY